MVEHQESTVVGFAGDWHGNISWIGRAIPALRRAGVTTLYHVGDFGIWPGETAFISTVEYWAKLAALTIWVTPGNHDDYDQIDALFAGNPYKPQQLSEHVWVLPRGHRWTHAGRSFVSLGGAASTDVSGRIPGKTWWQQEEIRPEDVARTISGGHAEVMISHDAPLEGTSAVARLRHENPNVLSTDALAYVQAGTNRLTEAAEAIRPTIHVHGHWHAPDEIQLDRERRVYSMGMDFQTRNLATLDLTSLRWSWLDDPKLRV
ncbi:metallophosphoesterase [Cryobacterium sp. Y29]|uniref:metallophosphoesterase family protein n=1 Tax=Cryobacterium sp. Y29 TaxID=2048285 RepID=UPI000CE2C692|nr:metallophosphoesterase [Cryobacterium sp. Y29]